MFVNLFRNSAKFVQPTKISFGSRRTFVDFESKTTDQVNGNTSTSIQLNIAIPKGYSDLF